MMRLSHSIAQFETDQIIASYFLPGELIYGIDVGAVDGIFISNTYLFEKEKGADILCIEANPAYAEALKRNRKFALSYAIGAENKDNVTFHVVSMDDLRNLSSVSALEVDQNLLEDHKRAYRISEYDVKVNVRTLDYCVKLWNPFKIDFVSIDVEGGEVDALKGFDIERWQPRLFVLEANSKAHADALVDYMSKFGYRLDKQVEVNLFFVR